MSKCLPKFFFYFLFSCFLFSCSEEKPSNCTYCGENLNYGNSSSGVLIDESNGLITIDTVSGPDEQFEENKRKIEAKYGEQWDFCHCIVANDSLDRMVKANVDLDEKFMARFEEVSNKCQAFLVQSPNITPDERAKHEQKARRCLKEARRR